MPDCTYTVPDLNASGDALYGPRICDQPFIDWAWDVHGFNGDYWQDGWGFDDVCNIRKPLARCLNAMWLLNYSAEDYMNEDWNSDALHWGPRYVREQFKSYDDLRADCGDGSATAVTTGCQWTRQWQAWRCTQGYNETKRECRSWFFLFAWICHLYAEVLHCVRLGHRSLLRAVVRHRRWWRECHAHDSVFLSRRWRQPGRDLSRRYTDP